MRLKKLKYLRLSKREAMHAANKCQKSKLSSKRIVDSDGTEDDDEAAAGVTGGKVTGVAGATGSPSSVFATTVLTAGSGTT